MEKYQEIGVESWKYQKLHEGTVARSASALGQSVKVRDTAGIALRRFIFQYIFLKDAR